MNDKRLIFIKVKMAVMEKNIEDYLKSPIQTIKGIGETKKRLLNKLNIFTVGDAIEFYPRGYEDRSIIKNISELNDGDVCSLEGVINSEVSVYRARKGMTVYSLVISDGKYKIKAVWFNQNYITNVFNFGEKYIFYGKITKRYGKFEINSPVYEKVDEDSNILKITPIYPSTAKLPQNSIRKIINSILEFTVGNFEEILPRWVREEFKLCEVNYALKNIHFPDSEKDFHNARYRLAFEELLLFQLGLFNIKSNIVTKKDGIKFEAVEEINAFIENLPFKLTNAQIKVWKEIRSDMETSKIMNRLVQGDVGSGKTIIAILALLKAIRNGYQGVLMVPTEILAEQHYNSITGLLKEYNIKTELLVGSITKKQKDKLKYEIKEGIVDLIIGTHAVLEENVEFNNLGLVVTDEQHRFGVRQRAILSTKGERPDILVMTATPIPRTLALILYGDLDISVIDELPPDRKPIMTYAVDDSMRDRINNFIKKNVEEGRQIYIVCPLVEESESIDANSAVETSERIANDDFKDYKVSLMHGKMKPREKDEIMKEFSKGEIDILVSTTVIEVGVNVPNASVMVIENAERFGLAQLHQLRGRVGRGKYQSYCILYNNSKSDISKERMNIMSKTNDGFIISEKDLELRGPGDFFGTRQHGIPELKVANLYEDIEILKLAQAVAQKILKEDKLMNFDENIKLKKKLIETFGNRLKNLILN